MANQKFREEYKERKSLLKNKPIQEFFLPNKWLNNSE